MEGRRPQFWGGAARLRALRACRRRGAAYHLRRSRKRQAKGIGRNDGAFFVTREVPGAGGSERRIGADPAASSTDAPSAAATIVAIAATVHATIGWVTLRDVNRRSVEAGKPSGANGSSSPLSRCSTCARASAMDCSRRSDLSQASVEQPSQIRCDSGRELCPVRFGLEYRGNRVGRGLSPERALSARSSNSTTPKDQMSVRLSTARPLVCSDSCRPPSR